MRRRTRALLWLAAFGAASSAGAEHRASAETTKTLVLNDPTAPGRPVSGAITLVVLNARGGGGSPVVTVEGQGFKCTIPLASAADAAAIEQRILDPKTTTVKCLGGIVAGANNLQSINPASEFWILSNP